jgi:hypothetical protein
MADSIPTPAEIAFVVEEVSGGGFIARAVGQSVFTEADSLSQLELAVREAVECHFGETSIPRVIRLRTSTGEILLATTTKS